MGSHRPSLSSSRDKRENRFSSKSASNTCISFFFLPELGTHNDILTGDRLCSVGHTPRFEYVLSNDCFSNVSHSYEPPSPTRKSGFDLESKAIPSARLKLNIENCMGSLFYHTKRLASFVDVVQSVVMRCGKERENQFANMPFLHCEKRQTVFCSIGLATRDVGSVQKLDLSQGEEGLESQKHLSERGNISSSGISLNHTNSALRPTVADTEENRTISDNSLFLTVKHLSAGAISAIVSRSLVAPLERLKLEYMVRGAKQNVLEIIRRILMKEGLQGFWRGNVVNLLRTAPFKSVNFFCYDMYVKRYLEITRKDEVGNSERLIAGAAAGISATLLCFPMDTIRTVLVAPGGETLGGVIGCFQHMVKTEGFFSLYKGLLPAVISMAPSGAVFYGVYDILKSSYLHSSEGKEDLRKRIYMERQRRGLPVEALSKEGSENLKEEAGELGQLELGPFRTLLYGAIAGICAETATYPFEVIRRNLQMQTATNKLSAFATCQGLVQREGLGALYSGLLPSSLQVLPSAAISYFVYEFAKVIFKVS